MLSQFKYCPTCKSDLVVTNILARCTSCDFVYYQDPAPTAGVIPVKDGKALVGVRSADPFAGTLDTIGGFIQAGEKPEEAAIRECREETGLEVEIIHFLGSYTDTYGNNGKPTLAFHYIGNIIGGELEAQDDISEARWIPIDELPLDRGFKNAQETFRDLQQWWHAQENTGS